jgi:hypothetical protein
VSLSQNAYINGDTHTYKDAYVQRSSYTYGDQYTYQNVYHRLGDNSVFQVAVLDNTSTAVNVFIIQPGQPNVNGPCNLHWFNVQARTWLGCDAYVRAEALFWKNYIKVSTAGESAPYTTLTLTKVPLVTDVRWEDDELLVTKTPYWLLVFPDPEGPADTVVITGTECPPEEEEEE